MKKSIISTSVIFIATLGLVAIQTPSYAALTVCSSDEFDTDGDGYGWENNRSCRVLAETITSNSRCQSASSDPDGDGFGWENGQTCLTDSTAPPPSTVIQADTKPQCSDASFDPDGDGYGWENAKTCLVSVATQPANPTQPATPTQPTTQSAVRRYPVCVSANSDPDGDGYGWENNKTCTSDNSNTTNTITALSPTGAITTGTPTFSWTAINADEYRVVVSDAAGNGYTSSVDPVAAGCQGGTGTCSYTPKLAYFDNNLTWVVQPVINGSNGTLSNRLSITTPFNPDIQPILSNQSSCEAWPAVSYDKFVVLNNSWNSRTMNRTDWVQKINIDQDSNGNIKPTWTYDWLGQYDGGEIEVKAYPEVIYGSKLGTHVSGTKAETGLPELVSALPEFTVDYAYSETGSAERNVALESFFHDSCQIAGPCDTVDNRSYEMMIWVNNPSIRTPGTLALTGVMIDNQLWNVYIKPNSNKHYIAFTAQNPSTTGTLHWNRFVDWTETWTAENAEALSINVLSPDFCMGAIELGTEMWWGAGSFTLDRYNISF